MNILTTADIRLGAAPESKTDAIRQAAAPLVEAGAIAPDYVESILARERVATTYIGNGVAIPHGLPKDAAMIRETRVAVLQVPDGVEWLDGKRAYLVFAIAAGSDEHIGLLTRLTGLVDDAVRVEALAKTHDPEDIVRALEAEDSGAGDVDDATFAGEELQIRFSNPRGFHLRPAAQFAEVAKEIDGEVALFANGRRADGKSAMSILKLGIAAGDWVRVRTGGARPARALARLRTALEDVLDEPAEPAVEAASEDVVVWEPRGEYPGRVLRGTAAAPGLAYGPLFRRAGEPESVAPRPAAGDERGDLERAIATAREQLMRLAEAPGSQINEVQRGLFHAHAELLGDPDLHADVASGVAAGRPATDVWDAIVEQRAAAIEALGDEHLSKRAADLRDIGRRVRRILHGVDADPFAGAPGPVLLVADDLDPSEAAQLRPESVLGICLAGGSPNAHSAIVARSLGIPMLVAVGDALADVEPGTAAILDAAGARLLLEPGDDDVASVSEALVAHEALKERAWESRFEPAILADGSRVEVVANIASVDEAARAIECGAEGVGLLRTEFLYLDRHAPPTEDEQHDALRHMLGALGGLPMIVRTMDIGGDKPVDYLGLDARDLSFLGLRGIRLSLARPELAATQLRAIFRASAHGPLRLMFPMIATPDDFLRAREMAEAARREVGAAPVEYGVMVEIPSAVTMAPELADLVDFFSVGTNDLTQYALAVDRTHPLLADRADSLHPVVLRMIDATVRAAHEAGRWVGVCGGLAADARGALVLVGLGVDELSVPATVVPQIKDAVRGFDMPALQALARRALRQRDAAAVRALPLPPRRERRR